MDDVFGDSGPDDAYAPAPPDPEQVARRLRELHDRYRRHATWHRLVADDLIAWLAREGAIRQ